MSMSLLCSLLGLLIFADLALSKDAAPKVQIYSRSPGHYDISNTLICHVNSFYPPELDLELLMDGFPMPGANQTDLAFEENWYYHLTKSAHFKPEKNHRYSCKVTHLGETKEHHWEPDV